MGKAAQIAARAERVLLVAARAQKAVSRFFRRLSRKPRTVAEAPNLLPTLIKVFAAFARVDGELLEEEIDSSLGFLRYDYPDTVYSELRKLFREALHEQQDLDAIAQKLAGQLDEERKILLGVQLYDLIAKAGLKQEQIVAYYSFMSRLGMAAQAIDIVYQLNADERSGEPAVYQRGVSPLEAVSFGAAGSSDVALHGFEGAQRLLAYRHGDLILIKNLSGRVIIVGGRGVKNGEFCRIFPGQRILAEDHVLTHADLVFYFNAKKGLTRAQIFVAPGERDEVRLEKNRTRDALLEVTFGLGVRVTALADVDAQLNGVKLSKGTTVNATLDDKIIFRNESELDLGDLRRRARQFGGRFHLKSWRSEYLVSNNPSLLREGDILLSPGSGGDVLLKIHCDYDRKVGRIEVLQSDRPILVRGTPVRNEAPLEDGDAIRIDAGQVLRCNFTERVIEEERNIIRTLEARDLTCRFRNGQTALDGVSFSVQRGEMVCVMGASGCGKSTLLRALAGQFAPAQGGVLFNGRSLYSNLDALRKYVAYIPQEDAFDEHLTIEENLSFAAALRAPHLSRRERSRRIDGKLAELGLNERRASVVGPVHHKILSGGERKRLNIGLDMIGLADIYLFDEPTSGLSSKDSEHVLEIIRGISHNKIVLVTIHQPTSKIFHMFQKAVLLDRGGKLVFFGTPAEMLEYFAEAEHEQQFGMPLGRCDACGTSRPEFIFDVLETPLRDLSGDIILEENNRGQLVPARRFPPDYWRDKFEAWRMIRDVREGGAAREPPPALPPPAPASRRREPLRWREEWAQFRVLLLRAFVSKLRNRANLAITLLAAPALALLIAFVLRYSKAEVYDFASSFHIPTYLFLALVVAMFLGLTNSVDDITRDKPVLFRERNLNVRTGYYVVAKALTLAVFAVVQCALFVLVGNAILEMRGVFWLLFSAMLLTTVSGFAIGLVISAMVNESKTAVLAIPVVLIPQIILAGALIEYEEMNRNLDFTYTLRQWASRNPGAATEDRSELEVPLLCEFIPMRWSYEALVYAQAKGNPLTSRQTRIQNAISALAKKPGLTQEESERLEDLKDLLAITSGLQAKNPGAVARRLREVDKVLAGAPLDRSKFKHGSGGVSAESLYVNQKVADLVAKAEMEQSDYRETRHFNVFFGPQKEYFGMRIGVIPFNTGVLAVSSLVLFLLLYSILRRQIRAIGG
ncbi:MAG: ATP-binding cassette domain-containing protein [Terrimicrobiaceae bacterium]|nr:ATP-binding cassette domain-containing protein [Terrimicrobiaceae bacterium]